MPAIIQGAYGKASQESFLNEEQRFDYDYPNELDLDPKSDFHKGLIDLVMSRAHESYNVIKSRHSSWNQIARSLSAYTRPEDVNTWKDKQKSDPIIIPVTFATLETILTYMVATFLDNPIFRYTGRSPEDEVGALLLQHVIAAQNDFSTIGLNLHTQWRDSFAFGFGAAATSWKTTVGKRSVFSPRRTGIEAFFLGNGGLERSLEEFTLFEGNEQINIDPYKYLPDPNVPIHEPQSGEFVGWFERDNRVSLLTQEKSDTEAFFNAKYLKGMHSTLSSIFSDSQGRDNMRGGKKSGEGGNVTEPVDVVHMYIDLVPSEHKLGKSDYPEKWKFKVAADSLILEARPLGVAHDQFPITVASPDFDGYSSNPASRLEIIYGLQETVDWLFSSHIANVRKAINLQLIVDPSRININDVANPRAGGIIRTRRAHWGRGVEGIIEQLKVSDITQGHMRDTSVIMELINRTSSASDMGQNVPMRSGERISAAEVEGIKGGSMSRLAKSARIISLQSMTPMARMMAEHTQEFMEEAVYTKIVGTLGEVLANEFGMPMPSGAKFPIRPQDVAVAYDVVEHDGTMPGTEDAQAWTQLFGILLSKPEIAQGFDVIRIFKHIARQMGAKNVDDFVRRNNEVQTQVQPDETVQKEVDRGNLVPIQ